jgi:hypothetical protein
VEGKLDTIRLTFTPKGKGNLGNSYYEHGLENKCVVCGAEQSLVKHNVIPHAYKRHFPLHVKSHASHDVLLFCVPCHMTCSQHNEILKSKLAEEMGVPLTTTPKSAHVSFARIRSAATAMLRDADKIPPERRASLLEVVAKHFGVLAVNVTTEMLEEASAFEAKPGRVAPEDTHEALLVAKLSTPDQRRAFCLRWRLHMLRTMQPRHLSPHWNASFARNSEDNIDLAEGGEAPVDV